MTTNRNNDNNYFIKILYNGGLESIINKPINLLNYQAEYLKIFNLLQKKHPDEELTYILKDYIMYIYIDVEDIEMGWLYNNITLKTIELCRLSLIEININLNTEILQ
jgi:disulfide oxidoreductase YuzD